MDTLTCFFNSLSFYRTRCQAGYQEFSEEESTQGRRNNRDYSHSGDNAVINGIAGIRAEDVTITEGDKFIIDIIENLGSEQLVTLKYMTEHERFLVVKSPSHIHYELREKVNADFSKENLHFFDGTTEECITE
nr:hypothetical protein [uncultured Peptoniphilus sp.]